jgi:pimeloyl-ACP methyl ester carboxylesterase
VLSLTSIMSSSGAPGLPGPRRDVARALMARPRSRAPQDVAEHTLALLRLIGSPAFPHDTEALREQLLAEVRRSHHPAGVARQMLAVMADTGRHHLLGRIACPTLVIHGTADPLVPIACGQDTARRIPGARFEAIEGMGHDWPPGVAARLAQQLLPHLQTPVHA